MTGRMRTSAAGLELIKTFEGLRETAVRLPDGRWTIGHGHVRTAREGLTVTAKDAEALLVQDLKPIENAVSAMIFAPLMQGQFDALVSLAYNISMGQFRESEIVGHLNAGNYLAAANGFDLWRKARLHGRVMVVDALVRRRAAEKALFLDHPSGPPSAPTPMVTPEMDFGSAEPPRAMPANRNDVEEPEEAPAPRTAPPSDIAEAVRRLAETTQQAIRPPQELSLPPGVVIVPDKIVEEPRVVEPEPVVEAVQEIAPEPVVERKPFVAPEPVQEQTEVTAEQIAHAGLSVAERVAKILTGVEQKLQSHEAKSASEAAVKPQPAVRADVREGLPDFDLPPERYQAEAQARPLIDDLEIVAPETDPVVLFKNGERKAKVVNGHARRVGPVSGRLLMLAPWVVVLALSVIGVVIGAVEAFRTDGAQNGAARLAGTVLAVFGVMMVMSLYFIFWKRTSDDV